MKLDLLGPGLVARTAPPLLQLSQIPLMKLDLQGSRSTAPRQNPHLKCCLVKLDRLGPEQVTQPELSKRPRSHAR